MDVLFKKGLKEDLGYLENYIQGSFYLLEDTEQLYYAKSNEEIILLNKNFNILNSRDDLPLNPSIGQAFYIISENQLLICSNFDSTNYSPIWSTIGNGSSSSIGAELEWGAF